MLLVEVIWYFIFCFKGDQRRVATFRWMLPHSYWLQAPVFCCKSHLSGHKILSPSVWCILPTVRSTYGKVICTLIMSLNWVSFWFLTCKIGQQGPLLKKKRGDFNSGKGPSLRSQKFVTPDRYCDRGATSLPSVPLFTSLIIKTNLIDPIFRTWSYYGVQCYLN